MAGEAKENGAAEHGAAPVVRMADADMHVKIGERVVPIGELVRDAGTYEAGQDALSRAREIEERSRTNDELANRYRMLQEQIAVNPQGVADSILARAGQRNTAGDDLGGGDPSSQPRVQGGAPQGETIAQLHARLANLESRTHQSDLEKLTDAVMDRFPVLKSNPAARRLARNVIYAGKVVTPDKTIDQIARAVYTDVVEALEYKPAGSASTGRDELVARMAMMPNISASLGSDAVKKIPEPTGDRGLSSKHFVHDTKAYIDALLGPTPPTS